MAMPVLNERMSESALLAAGARGENISRVVAAVSYTHLTLPTIATV